MADDYHKMVEDKIGEFSALFTRMDKDKDLYYLDPYVMTDFEGNATKDVVNVTFNDSKTFADRTIGILNAANMQIVVEGKGMGDKKTGYIEDFLRDIYLAIDERLLLRLIPSLYAFLIEQVCIRGPMAVRCLMRMDGDRFVPDVLPLDTRLFVYEPGVDGMRWGAYLTSRSKERIREDYGVEVAQDTSVITDFWGKEVNVVYAEKEDIRNLPHDLGYPPFIYVLSPTGSMLQDSDYIGHQGESIFAANRNLYPELNRVASILQTLNIMSFEGGLQYASTTGEAKNLKGADSPYGSRKVMPVDIGGGFTPMPINDIKAAARLFYAILDARLQRGGLPTIDFGNLQFPLSGSAIGKLEAHKDQIFFPRIQGIAMLYQQLSRMIIRQYIEKGFTVELGEEGKKQEYEASKLKGDYSIKFKFFSKSPERDILNYSMAAAAKGFASDDTIRRNILQFENPDEERQQIEAEQAERIHPALFMYRRAGALIDEGKPLEAYMIAQRCVQMLRQMQMVEGDRGPAKRPKESEVEPPRSEPGQSPLVPLMGAGAPRAVSPEVASEAAELRRAGTEEAA